MENIRPKIDLYGPLKNPVLQVLGKEVTGLELKVYGHRNKKMAVNINNRRNWRMKIPLNDCQPSDHQFHR